MDHQVKRNINKIANKFNHQIEYAKDVLVLKSDLNEIKIKGGVKNHFSINYNVKNESQSLEIDSEDVYDILLELFWRKEEQAISLKGGHLITWDLFVEIEPDEKFWLSVFKKLKSEIDENEILFREIGGNRILVEYYDGLLILYDDLNYYKSNIYELKTITNRQQ